VGASWHGGIGAARSKQVEWGTTDSGASLLPVFCCGSGRQQVEWASRSGASAVGGTGAVAGTERGGGQDRDRCAGGAAGFGRRRLGWQHLWVGGSLGWRCGWPIRSSRATPILTPIASSSFSWEWDTRCATLEKGLAVHPRPHDTSPTSRSMSTSMSTQPEMFRASAEEFGTISFPATPFLFLYEQTRDAVPKAPIPCAKPLLPTRATAMRLLHSTDKPNQMCVDGVFMGRDVSARYGHATGDTTAFDEVVTQMTDIVNHCMKTDGLF